jgi:hypothetical protein
MVMEERPIPAPDASWVISVEVEFSQAGGVVATLETLADANGVFTITEGIDPGDYDIRAWPMHSLKRLQQAVTIPAAGMVTFGTAVDLCFEGDANEDNIVDISDFTLWKARLMTTDPMADFNNDGLVDISDFTIWKRNLMKVGDSLP